MRFTFQMMNHQQKGNKMNWFIKAVHQKCIVPGCSNSAEAFHHLYQKGKTDRPAEMAKGNKDALFNEYKLILPVCASHNNRFHRSITPEEMRSLDKIWKLFNVEHNGIEYRIGIPMYILKWLQSLLYQPYFINSIPPEE